MRDCFRRSTSCRCKLRPHQITVRAVPRSKCDWQCGGCVCRSVGRLASVDNFYSKKQFSGEGQGRSLGACQGDLKRLDTGVCPYPAGMASHKMGKCSGIIDRAQSRALTAGAMPSHRVCLALLCLLAVAHLAAASRQPQDVRNIDVAKRKHPYTAPAGLFIQVSTLYEASSQHCMTLLARTRSSAMHC